MSFYIPKVVDTTKEALSSVFLLEKNPLIPDLIPLTPEYIPFPTPANKSPVYWIAWSAILLVTSAAYTVFFYPYYVFFSDESLIKYLFIILNKYESHKKS